MVPENDNLPPNYYLMKKKLRAFGLNYDEIDVCENVCMLFYDEFKQLDNCLVCGHPRYIQKNASGSHATKTPYKSLRYFPLIPRLQHFFMSKTIA